MLWAGHIGNLYESPGIILGIPALIVEEWDGIDESPYTGGAEDLMREKFADYLDSLRRYSTTQG